MSSAPFLRRTAAFVIDAACAAAPLWLVSPVAYVFWHTGPNGQLAAMTMLTANGLLSLALFYVWQTVQFARGRSTPGRLACHLEVSRRDGKPTRLREALLRQGASLAFLAGCLLSGLYPLLLAPALWALIDRSGRGPADIIAGTRVQDRTVITSQAATAESAESRTSSG